MTTKIRPTLITALFVFAMFTALQAQEKYEYAVVFRNSEKVLAVVTKDGTEIVEIKKGQDPVAEQIKKINELSGKGWEVYNTTQEGATNIVPYHTYYLKRKLKE